MAFKRILRQPLFIRNDIKEKSWAYDFVVNGKRYRATLGNISKTRAKEMYEKAKVAAREGRYEDPTPKKDNPYLGDFIEEYLDYYRANRRPRSVERHETSWVSLEPVFAKKRLSEITSLDLERYRRNRQKVGKSDVTINRELALMRNIYSMAIEWGKAEKNPVKGVKLARENNQRIRYLSHDEEERLVRTCKGPLRPVVITAIHTGFRKTELLSLTWDDVDFERATVAVKAGYAKNGESRSIPMNELLKQTLEEVRISEGAVFRSRTGQPYKSIRTAFTSALKRAEIEDFTFHDLRHTFASRLVMGGVDLPTVKELMGHKDITMTLRYAHLSDRHKQKAVEVLLPTYFTTCKDDGKTADHK